MAAYADLEIGLHRWSAESYAVELRYSQPGSDADTRLVQGGSAQVQFDLARLRALALDGAAYGQLLGESLLKDKVGQAFRAAWQNAQSLGSPLRLRLFIGPSAPELHGLRWETLRDPLDGAALLTGERILFSRYLSSYDWRRVRLRSQGELSALVVVANPANLATYRPDGRPLAPVDVAGELARAEAGLGEAAVVPLASGGAATLDKLVDGVRAGHDVLYLVCHGALDKSEPRLWLEDDAGQAAVVAGTEFVARLGELLQPPRLVVLASCQSAGTGDEPRAGDEGALAALGPRLAEAGVPAVLAMQGNVSMRTVEAFMPVFFRELQSDGQIDRAMAVARGAVRERDDAWMPTLFMRLRSGRLWYAPGFAGDRPEFDKWPVLLGCVREGTATPILGPGLAEAMVGSRREIAQRWADTYGFPMSPHDRDDLPQVAQYLAVRMAPMFPPMELAKYLRQDLLRRYKDDLPPELQTPTAPLVDLLAAVAARQRERNPAEPHRVLAALPFPLYVTSNIGSALTDALRAAGKEPRVEICRWNEQLEGPLPGFGVEPDARPDPDRPLVYHLFGHLDVRDSLVLTEDDYFDYLIGVTRRRELIPAAVRRALTNTALLFLGFQMDDWNFRVLFRSIMSQEGSRALKRYAHVAVQVDPEEDRTLEPERARAYLESYFEGADISVYWGSVEDFAEELLGHDQGGGA